jgi:hypothetical protein
MKKSNILILSIVALAGFMAITVFAQNAHFMSCSSSTDNTTGCLSVSFRIAGLGGGERALITAHTTATEVWGCLNHGQQCPNAANKFTTSEELTGETTVRAGHNGSASGQITLCPSQPTDFSCPRGQELVLISVTYSDVTLTNDHTADTCETSGGTFNDFPQCP